MEFWGLIWVTRLLGEGQKVTVMSGESQICVYVCRRHYWLMSHKAESQPAPGFLFHNWPLTPSPLGGLDQGNVEILRSQCPNLFHCSGTLGDVVAFLQAARKLRCTFTKAPDSWCFCKCSLDCFVFSFPFANCVILQAATLHDRFEMLLISLLYIIIFIPNDYHGNVPFMNTSVKPDSKKTVILVWLSAIISFICFFFSCLKISF